MDDMISRKMAIDALRSHRMLPLGSHPAYNRAMVDSEKVIRELPSAQPEVRPIDYQDCSNAMLKMWMDNVVTDGEYNRIMDKLNAHWGKNEQV